MTNKTETRPSDEVTGKVVAKWIGWKNFFLLNEEDSEGLFWDVACGLGPFRFPVFHSYERDSARDLTGYVFDPRDCHETAMELLRVVINKFDQHYALIPAGGDEGWMIFDTNKGDDFWLINDTSGQAFRYAVVNLAAKVMGIERQDNEEAQSHSPPYK